jgi:serine/threonine protein kinase/tetratricopeptide (TPR) repeat protein
MTPDRWRRAQDLFTSAIARSPEARTTYLGEICGDDLELRHEVESLLASYEAAPDGFLERPAIQGAESMAATTPSSCKRLARGARFGNFEIVDFLGAGGMGEVYRARDSRLGRDVAIKILPLELASDRDRLRRFEKEARAASALNHGNIVTIYETGTLNGVPFIAMEYVEGSTLRSLLAGGPFQIKKALSVAAQLLEGLSRAHEAGMVHRDLKPENVMVTKDGLVKILDFGLAKLTAPVSVSDPESQLPTVTGTSPGIVIGTLGYMSPEQVRGLPLDHRSDIFSFGAILYEMLSGKRAFQRDNPADTISAITRDDPPGLTSSGQNISPALDHIVKHCIEKTREQRFQSAHDVAFALSEASSQANAVVAPAVLPRKTGGKRLVMTGVLVVLAAAGVFFWRRQRAPSPTSSSTVKRIAVLPFENLGSPEDDYFADGMSDAVRAKLTSLSGIEVIARGSSVGYKKTSKTPKEIAKDLDVPYLLTATVRWQKNGDKSRIEVTPELVEVKESGPPSSKWQQPFDAALTDVFQVQADVATKVAQALDVELAADDVKEIRWRPTQNLAAYDAFLKGSEAQQRFEFKEAREALERALALDPHFAMAMLRLADLSDREQAAALVRRADRERDHLTDRERYHVDIALANVDGKPERAFQLGHELHAKYPDDLVGATQLAREAILRGDLDEAIRRWQEVLAVDPNYSDAYNQLGYFYTFRGDYDRALKYLHKYEAMNVGRPNPHDSIGEVQANSGHYNEAIENLNRALAIKPDFEPAYQHLGVAYEGMGDYPKAIAMYEKAATLDETENLRWATLSFGARAALIAGNSEAAGALLNEMGKIPDDAGNDPDHIRPALRAAAQDIAESRFTEAERRLHSLEANLDDAFEKLQKAGRVEPGLKAHFPSWNWLMAMALEKQGRTDEALAFYEKNANPPNPVFDFGERRWIMEARAKVAEIIARKGDLDRAEKLIAENHKWNPNWAPNKPSELIVEQLRHDKVH